VAERLKGPSVGTLAGTLEPTRRTRSSKRYEGFGT
jgi:hypothetical protein